MTREQEQFVSDLATENESVTILPLSNHRDAPVIVKIPNGARWVVDVNGNREPLNPAITKIVVRGEEF